MRASRHCGGCGADKPLEDFAWRRTAKGQRDNLCRPCRKAYHRQHYLDNRARYVEQARLRKQRLARERTEWLVAYFASHPCADCGVADPVILEFDHLGDKEFDVSAALPYRAWSTILAEIDKCDVVCANCHRIRTARRRRSIRWVLTRG